MGNGLSGEPRGGLPSHEVAGTKSQCRSADFAQWNARLG